MKQKYSLFSYKKGNSFLHKCPSWIKLLFIPAASIMILLLPYQFAVCASIALLFLSLIIKISILEQFTDIKPIFYYAILLFFFQVISLDYKGNGNIINTLISSFSWENQKDTVCFLMKLTAVMQVASLLYKTSTSLELRDGISLIEMRIRIICHLKKENSFSEMLFMFLNFIPMISSLWEELKRAWLARCGKSGIKMYISLLPVLFFLSMKKAWNMSRAIEIRK